MDAAAAAAIQGLGVCLGLVVVVGGMWSTERLLLCLGFFYEEIYLSIPDIARDYVFLIEALPVRHIDIFTAPSTNEKRMILSAIVSFVAPTVFVCVWYLCISAMGRRRVSASTPV